MSDPIFNTFLERQLTEGLRLAAGSDLFRLVPQPGRRPTHFGIELTCKGLARERGRVVEHSHWAFGIFFPDDYLRRPVDVAQVLMYLGSAAEPFHPNLRPPFVCMHLAPGAPLVEIVMGLFELVTWSIYSTSDEGLNHAASQWARHQDPRRFPVDRRPLKRRPDVGLPLAVPVSPS